MVAQSSFLVLLWACAGVEAFSPSAGVLRSRASTTLWSSAEDEVAALRAAAAKAREEAARLSEELGKDSPAAIATAPKKSRAEFEALLPALIAERDVNAQATQWAELKDSKSISAFGQANLRTFPVSLSMLNQRTGLSAESLGLEDPRVDLDDFKYATLYVVGGCSVAGVAALAFLPPNVGATVCYMCALTPIAFLGVGSTAPGFIADAIARLKGTADMVPSVSPQERIIRHEAAHFCVGYWCGLPVADYSVAGEEVARVEFGTPSVGSSGLSATQISALSITALAGLVAEATEWQRAEGAQSDLVQLSNVFRQSSEFIGSAQEEDLTRWGALTAAQLLKANQEQYEKVVDAFARKASVEECILLLES